MAENDQTAEAAPKPGWKRFLTKGKVIAFVVAIVVLECGIASLYLPGSSQPTAAAQTPVEDKVEKEVVAEQEKPKAESTEANPDADQIEVDLGEFKVTSYRPESESTWYIDFHLWGTIRAEDEEDFNARWVAYQNRVRERVLIITRSLTREDFSDAGLGLIRRQVLEKSNKTLGKPVLRGVIFSEFSFMEQ